MDTTQHEDLVNIKTVISTLQNSMLTNDVMLQTQLGDALARVDYYKES
jgi:hypothetical protein